MNYEKTFFIKNLCVWERTEASSQPSFMAKVKNPLGLVYDRHENIIEMVGTLETAVAMARRFEKEMQILDRSKSKCASQMTQPSRYAVVQLPANNKALAIFNKFDQAQGRTQDHPHLIAEALDLAIAKDA